MVELTDLLVKISEAHNFANIKQYSYSNIASQNMDLDFHIRLAKTIEEQVQRDDVDAIIITHGTDTLESIAFLLEITINTDKPIVLVGSMRPDNALSSDGPLNLLQAISLASNHQSRGSGVLVCLNDRIVSGYYLSKINANTTNTFGALEQGYLGQFIGLEPKFYFQAGKALNRPFFELSKIHQIKEAAIVQVNFSIDIIKSFLDILEKEKSSFILKGYGNGSIPESLIPRIRLMKDKGIIVVRTSSVFSGYISKSLNTNTIASGFLNANKSKILLSLCISTDKNYEETEEIFGT